MNDEPEQHISTTEARGGSNIPVNRIVLAASLVLIIVAFVVIFFVFKY